MTSSITAFFENIAALPLAEQLLRVHDESKRRSDESDEAYKEFVLSDQFMHWCQVTSQREGLSEAFAQTDRIIQAAE